MTRPLFPAAAGTDPRGAPRGRIVRAETIRFWHDAADLLEAARRDAARIRAEAEAERDRIVEEGRQTADLHAAALVTERLAAGTAALAAFLERIDEHLAELVVEQVARIIGARDPRDSLIGAAASALRDFRHAKRLLVRVPHADADWVEGGLTAELEPALRALVVVQPDPTLAPGRCVVSCEFGVVEAGIAAQIAAVRSGLLRRPDGADDV